MIAGVVKSDEARIRLTIRGRRGRECVVEAVIDTGFTGALTLPTSSIVRLNLRQRGVGRATLADGGTCVFRVFEAKLIWDGKMRAVLVAEADADPLVGMKLLRGHELKMHVRFRGKVTIQRLPTK